MLADNGLQISAVGEVTKWRESPSAVVSRLYVTKSIAFLVMMPVLAAIGVAVHLSWLGWTVGILTMIRLVMQSYSQLQLAILKTLDRMQIIGALQAIHFTVLSLGIAWIYFAHRRFEWLLGWFIVGQCLEFLLSLSVLMRIGVGAVRVRLRECMALLKRSTPVGFSYALASVILRTDIIVLSMIAPLQVVGHFAAAQVVITAVYVVSWLFGTVVLPEMTRRVHEGVAIEAYVRRWTLRIVASVLPASVLSALLVPRIMLLLYGSAYAETGSVAAIMLLGCTPIFLNALNFNRAVALNAKRIYLRVYVSVAILTVILDFVSGQLWGANGIAVAVVLREAVMLTMFKLASGDAPRVAAQGA